MLCKNGTLRKETFCILSLSLCIFLSTIKPSWANKDKLLKSSWFESLFSLDQPLLVCENVTLAHFFPFLYPNFWHPLPLSWVDLSLSLFPFISSRARTLPPLNVIFLLISCFFHQRANCPLQSDFSQFFLQVPPLCSSLPPLSSALHPSHNNPNVSHLSVWAVREPQSSSQPVYTAAD